MARRHEVNLKRKLDWRNAALGMTGLAAAALAISIEGAGAKTDRETRREGQSRAPGKPVLAIVSLNDQRISIYDANGKILQAPVSTGSAGYETPAGVFTIVQKKEMHQSNLYEDGQMPFMQRITWTGIALHAGVLPGHPASHGCIRLPMAFAQQLFNITDMGMRVLLVRDDMAPSEVTHPALFKSGPVRRELASALPRSDRSLVNNPAPVRAPDADVAPGSARHLQILQSIAAARTAESEAAAKREKEARQLAARRASEATGAARGVRAAEANLARGESALKDAERRLERTAAMPQGAPQVQAAQQAELAKAKAISRVSELQAQLQAAQLQAQARQDASDQANEEARVAAVARASAALGADEATRKTLPVSVFVSRKTQRLYIRKANYPVYEGPVTIREPQASIGTFVFTALTHLGTSGEMRWSVAALYPNPTDIEPAPSEPPRRVSTRYSDGAQPQPSRRLAARNVEATRTDVTAAKAALDRIAFSREALDVISDVVLPGSSLIISDEGPSRETGKDTDFVVVMSGEPQGALKVRQREPIARDEMGFGRSPFGGFRFPWD